MEENNKTRTLQEDTEDISFGGGADNEFIKSFAETPRYGRTLEEIERSEKNPSAQGRVDPETRERVRAQAIRRYGQSGRPAAAVDGPGAPADPGWRIGGKVNSADPSGGAPTARMPQGYAQPLPPQAPQGYAYPQGYGYPQRPAQNGYIQPLAEEPPAPQEHKDAPAQPKTGFQRTFSTRRGFARHTLVLGVLSLFWDCAYFFTLIERTVQFNETERTYLMQGVREFTMTFESPLISVLKVLMYVLPVLILIWALRFRRADKKNAYYNRRTLAVVLALIIVAVFILVLDLTGQHLLV